MRVAYVPERFLAEAIAAGLPDAEGARILLARADIADTRLVDGLQARGATVDQFVAYRTLLGDEDADGLREHLAGRADRCGHLRQFLHGAQPLPVARPGRPSLLGARWLPASGR